jgi:hypothetical protein
LVLLADPDAPEASDSAASRNEGFTSPLHDLANKTRSASKWSVKPSPFKKQGFEDVEGHPPSIVGVEDALTTAVQ